MLNVLNKISGVIIGPLAGILMGIPFKLVENFGGGFYEGQSVPSIIFTILVSTLFSPLIATRAIFAGLGEGLRIGVKVGYQKGISSGLIDIPKEFCEFEMGVISTKWVYPKVTKRAEDLYQDLEQGLNITITDFESIFKKLDCLYEDVQKCERIEDNNLEHNWTSKKLQLDATKQDCNTGMVRKIKASYIKKFQEEITLCFQHANDAIAQKDLPCLDSTINKLNQYLYLLANVLIDDDYQDENYLSNKNKENHEILNKFYRQLSQVNNQGKAVAHYLKSVLKQNTTKNMLSVLHSHTGQKVESNQIVLIKSASTEPANTSFFSGIKNTLRNFFFSQTQSKNDYQKAPAETTISWEP